LRGLSVVGAPLIVEEGVSCVGVDFDVVDDVIFTEFNVQLVSCLRSEIFVGIGADDGTGTLDRL
jgi:hypothetical protein